MFNLFKKKKVEWPFDQPKNCAVYTIRQIIEGECPILVVYHDPEDDGWQFMSNIEFSADDMKMVGLEQVTELDPSVMDVAHIKPGYHAWRSAVGEKWIVAQTPVEVEE